MKDIVTLDAEQTKKNLEKLDEELDNILLTPHNAALTLECRMRMSQEAAENIYFYLKEKNKLNYENLVNKNYL